DGARNPMETYRGLWVCLIPEVKQGDNYKYAVDGADGEYVLKADPFAVHAEAAPATASKAWDIALPAYDWNDADWLERRAAQDILHEPVSIYELHLGSWRGCSETEQLSYGEIAGELVSYVLEMGFTHVELMPVNEYPYGGSWGYQVTGFFAITSRYGTPQDFMAFVDTLHRAGIGVIVDWVPAHFPKDRHGLRRFDGSWLYEHANPHRREHPEWGTHEFDYARNEVRSFLLSSAVNLIEAYHVDGLRVDAVSSMLYLNYGRQNWDAKSGDEHNIDQAAVRFLKQLNTTVLGRNPGVVTIAEESTAYPLVTKPPYDGGLGFTFKWNMGFMHDTLDYMKIDPWFRPGSHDKLTFSMFYAFSENYILPYSHDEVVHGKASMIGKMYGNYEEKFSSLRTLYGYLFGHPGKKLIFMGGEFAQFIEWNYERPLDWFLLSYPSHDSMRRWVAELGRLYHNHGALYEADDSWDGFQWLNVDDRGNSVLAFLRTGRTKPPTAPDRIVCLYNFTPVAHEDYLVALPGAGSLTLLLSSDEATYSGAGMELRGRARALPKELNGLPYAARLSLPPLSALFYQYDMIDTDESGETDTAKPDQ
ncbi:MAG: 1,4-alpha-glucan branching protein GlgB, partial [Clostridiales bacterium]|nr:1,4-alpha-glucan branching protein GlgB [Clostridiales bacterium]